MVAIAGVALHASSLAAPRPAPASSVYRWRLPAGFPAPKVPADNPMSDAKVALGRHLFHDPRLSGNGTQSCASCHRQDRAFAEPLPRAVGSTGEMHPRNSMSLANVAYVPTLNWADPNVRSLEAQAMVPMFGEHPVEMGLTGREAEMLERLRAEPRYVALFAEAFPGEDDAFTVRNVVRAIASFERTLISGDSPYDRYRAGDDAAICASARRGELLFFSVGPGCSTCHGGFNFSDATDNVGRAVAEPRFHNTGLYDIDGAGAYPAPNTGVHRLTGRPEDMGRFRAPTLRNIALTAPYMHDGSIATLEEVVDHYAAGGRTIASGPNAGVGSRNPHKSPRIAGFALTPGQRADLVAFLQSLTDSAFVADPRFGDPWRRAADAR